MPRMLRFRVTNSETREAIEFDAEFDDAEWALLRRFQEYAADLNDCEQVKAGLMNNYTIEFGTPDGMTVTSLPRRAVVAELVLYLRPFVLQNEDTYFTKITGVLSRRLNHERMRSMLRSRKDEFLNKHSRALYELTIGDVSLNTEETLQTWLNGAIYHRDEEKRLAVENLTKTMPAPVMNAIMLDLLAVKAACVLDVAQLIRALDQGITISIA
jgi:hypothetical protein